MKKILIAILGVMSVTFFLYFAKAQSQTFEVRVCTPNDFYTFTKIFAEMRKPLRVEILKDRKTNFENADPLKYVAKIKEKKDVKESIASAGLTWEQFEELMGNILLAYFSIQPQKTKAAMIRQLADYGLIPDVPDEYQQVVADFLKSSSGSELASMALDIAVQIPAENIAIAREKQGELDRFFYTKYWKDKQP